MNSNLNCNNSHHVSFLRHKILNLMKTLRMTSINDNIIVIKSMLQYIKLTENINWN